MNTCRFCGERAVAYYNGRFVLLHYGPRHYAHPKCGLQKHGAAFFKMLSRNDLENFPALTAASFNLYDELRAAIEEKK